MTGFQFGASSTAATTTSTPSSALTNVDTANSGSRATPGMMAGNANAPLTRNAAGNNSESPHPSSSSSSSILEIPCLEQEFPNLAVHFHLESILESLQDPSLSQTDQMLQGQELFHLVETLCHKGTDATRDSTYSQSLLQGYNLSNPRPFSPHGSHPNGLEGIPPSHILLPGQSSLPTPLPPSILTVIETISSCLRVSLAQAGALYGACILDALDPVALGSDTVSWFDKRHLRPWTAQGFVEMCLEKFQRDQCYISSSTEKVQSKASVVGTNQDVVCMAMNLYFLERGCQLETILMIMQYRISALQTLLDCADKSGSSSPVSSSEIILQATNQLLEFDLVSNLVQLVRDLTMSNEELKHKICAALHEHDKNANDRENVQRGGFMNTSSFHASSNANSIISDADYAMYEFTLLQRHLACRCLFYLMYHTKCTVEEVTDIIDLIYCLTNGDKKLGMVCGLPNLDPIRDVPDPYVVRWRKIDMDSEKSGGSNIATTHNDMQNLTSMTPQQVKAMKDHQDWREELFANLWSIRGLSQATVTTTHTDFSGQTMYHSLTLGELYNQRGLELVDGGKPQLMQCVTVLILTVSTVFVSKNDVVNRHFKDKIQIENGCALIMGCNLAIAGQVLEPIVDRLDPSSQRWSSWKRRDIAGLLAASFGLFLNHLVTSSSSQFCTSGEHSELKALLQTCLEISTTEKSITFARVSLLSCLDAVSVKAPMSTLRNDFEFYMSVMTDFSVHYLDAICLFGELPISRRKWLTFEQDELQLRQVQEQQRQQLEEWSGKVYHKRTLREEVDLSRRPDCIDDIIALAVSICSTFPNSSQKFWSICYTGEDDKSDVVYHLKPTRIMKRLEKSQAKDPSLAPVYVAFLSALALANDPNGTESGNSGADAIFDWLCNNNRFKSSPTSYDSASQINWNYILLWLQLFQDQLSPALSAKSQSGWGGFDGLGSRISQNEGSTSYYYGSDDWENLYTSNVSSNGKRSKEKSFNAVNQKGDLDSWTKMLLLSYLSLISHIAFRSYRCRKEFLDMKVEKSSTSHVLAKDEDILTILFSLSTKPISSESRGLIFTTIANLVRQRPDKIQKDEKKKSDDSVLKCWELMESSQILPIFKLCQYSPLGSSIMTTFGRSQSNIEMTNWFPPNEEYGIIYEMEYIESKAGYYPSTEGFLKLLASLFSCDAYPCSLGSSWRPQVGCSPYVEYVTDFVLPRILDSHRGEQKLHFASETDKSRLVARALEVLDTILVRYVPPTLSMTEGLDDSELSSDQTMRRLFDIYEKLDLTKGPSNISQMAMSLIQRSIFPNKVCPEKFKQALVDFSDERIQCLQDCNQSQDQPLPLTTPRAKSPGYYILIDLLSSNGLLFDRLTELLTSEAESKAESVSTEMLVVSLYGEYSPSYHLAKTGRDYIIDAQKSTISEFSVENLDSDFVQSFAKDLFMVQTEDINDDSLVKSDGMITPRSQTVMWRDFSTLLALKILCSAAARADAFIAVSRALQTSLTVIPVLRFNIREVAATNPLFIKNFRVDLLSKRLLEKICPSSSNPPGALFLAVIFYFVGYQSSTLDSGNTIALMATSILKYLTLSSSAKDLSSILSGLQPSIRIKTSTAVSSRLSLIPLRKDDLHESYLVDELLKLILFHLRSDDCSEHNLAIVLLGLSELSAEDRKKYLWKSLQGFSVDICNYSNALDVILELLSNVDFVLNPKTSKLASRCFEIIFRLCELSGKTPYDSIHLCVMSKLRTSEFWKSRLLQLVGIPGSSDSPLETALLQSPLYTESLPDKLSMDIIERDNNIIQGVSWLLKGVAYEVHFLMGHIVEMQNIQPHQSRQIIELLLGNKFDILFSTLIHLPLTAHQYISSELMLKTTPDTCASTVTFDFNGEHGVYDDCSIIDESFQFCKHFDESKITGAKDGVTSRDTALMWARLWKTYIKRAHASSHVIRSWSILCSTIFISCRQVLLTSFNDDDPSPYNGDTALRLLKRILSLFSGHFDHKKTIMRNCYDKESLLVLSTSCFPLVEFILDLYYNFDEADIQISQQDISSIIELLIDAIVSCRSDSYFSDQVTEEIVAVFATVLSYILESKLLKTKIGVNNFVPESTICEKGVVALLILTDLSLRNTVEMQELDSDTSCVHDMATYGSASFLYWLECMQLDRDAGQTVMFKLFDSKSELSSLSKIIGIISYQESAVHLLQAIACCKGGADLLIEMGVTEEVIKVSLQSANDVIGARNTSMSAQFNCPNLLSGHVTLLNSLMSANISGHFTHRLLLGVSKFIQIHLTLIEALIDQFPLNGSLLQNFMIAMSLVTSYTYQGSTIQIQQIFEGSNIHVLDRVVYKFAMNISQYPLPGFVIPVLPSHLRRFAQEKSWWDKIANIPDDPLVYRAEDSASAKPQHSYGNNIFNQPLTLRMYSYAWDAASCLDISLTYLINRSTPAIDLGTLAVALYRCAEISCAVETRLKYVAMSNDNVNDRIIQLTDLNYGENNSSLHDLSRKREFEWLETLGASLASCLFKLMQITKLNIDHILDSSKVQLNINSINNISTSCHCIRSVLKNIDIQTACGCMGMLDNDEVMVEILKANFYSSLIGLDRLCGNEQK